MSREDLLKDIVRTFEGINKSKAFLDVLQSVKGEKVLLIYLFDSGGTSTPGTLAQLLNVSAARIAAILKTLEGKNLIERITDGADKRRVTVKLTESGTQLVEGIRNQAFSRALEIFEKLGEEDSLEFIRIIKKIMEYEEMRTVSDTMISANI